MSDENLVSLDEKRKARKTGASKQSVKDLQSRMAALNKEFAVVLIGGRALVLHEAIDAFGKDVVDYLSVSSLRTWLETERVFDPETERFVGVGDIWLKNPLRRQFCGVAFAPEGAPAKFYNLWRGFTVEPAAAYDDPREHKRHFATFFDHIERNVARGDRSLARWVWGWFAHMIQRPTERIGTALVLRGKQGAGKTKPGEIIGSLIGQHWVLIDDPKHLVGSFNAHMVSCMLLQADEGFWAGDKTAEGRLKGLVTSKIHLIEKKGVDAIQVRNLIRLLVTSNNDWVVPAGMEERRFAVLDVGDENMQDRAFFKKMDDELAAGGREHLLTYLMRFDLSKVDVREIPNTEGLYEQKVASMSEFQSWWFDRLRSGKLLPQHGKWQTEVPVDPLYQSYLTYSERMSKGRRMGKEQFGLALRKIVPERGFKLGQKIWVQVYGEAGEEIRNAD